MIKPGYEYRFLYGKPGLFLEMYVPKQYECFVRSTLETALRNHDDVKRYLSEHMLDVRKFLGKDERQAKDLNKPRIASIQQVLEGYSVYSGDGMFHNQDDPPHPFHDAIVVFRIMFLPDLDNKPEYGNPDDTRFAARRYLRWWTHDKERYLGIVIERDFSDIKVKKKTLFKNLEKLGYIDKNGKIQDKFCTVKSYTGIKLGYNKDKIKQIYDILQQRYLRASGPYGKEEKRLIDYLDLWLEDIHFFMYGYVLYNLCKEIIRRNKSNKNDKQELKKELEKKLEKEIWIGSFRCLAVNLIKLRDS